jgi:hypothetical protein
VFWTAGSGILIRDLGWKINLDPRSATLQKYTLYLNYEPKIEIKKK